MLIPRVYIIPELRAFKNMQNEEQSTLEKYNNYIEKGIEYILSHIHNIINYKTKELRIKIINKYIKSPESKKSFPKIFKLQTRNKYLKINYV